MSVDIEKKDAEITDGMLTAVADKWIEIGLAVKELDQEKAKEVLSEMYKAAGMSTPEFRFYRSPNEICTEGAKLEAPDESDSERNSRVRDLISSCIYGQHDGDALSRADALRNLYDLKEETEEAVPYMEAAPHLHWVLPFENVCLVSDFPEFVKLDDEGNLHADDGPAMRYRDGMELHYLWGVEVPEWVANTSPDDMDVSRILEIEDVDVRTVALQKCGVHRAKDALKVEVLDTDGDYELWTYEVADRRIGPALKMVNPTTGKVHVEGVGEPGDGMDESIKTVRDALEFRDPRLKGKEWKRVFQA